jgi:hypothetical protein
VKLIRAYIFFRFEIGVDFSELRWKNHTAEGAPGRVSQADGAGPREHAGVLGFSLRPFPEELRARKVGLTLGL